jgi:predicted nucleic acid-binding Zn ribbon protein
MTASSRYKNQQFSHISEVLADLVKQMRRESQSDLDRIRQIWQSVLDPVIAENSRPEALKNNELLVNVASSTITQQMRFLTHDVTEQINRVMGEGRIGRIRYKVGPVRN